MNRLAFTYKQRNIFFSVIAWEILFWSAFLLLLNIFGFHDSDSSANHLAFKFPVLLSLNLLLLPIIGLYFYNLNRTSRLVKDTPEKVYHYFLMPVSSVHSFLKYFFFRNAFVFLILTMAQPIYGNKKVAGTVESLELVVALDISNSMNTEDIAKGLSRLDVSKRALIQLVNGLKGEKLGICIFAGNAYVQLPLTTDYHAAKLFINEIETGMISNQGTNVSQALKTSLHMFSKAKTTKGIILVTDGENHEANPEEVLTEINEKNVQVCVLGIGTVLGGLIPNNPERPELGYKVGAQGENIVSKVNDSLIQELASKTNGYSMVSSEPFPDFSNLLTQINHMKRTKIDNLEFNVLENRYQVPLFFAIIFWLLFIVWSKNAVSIVIKRRI